MFDYLEFHCPKLEKIGIDKKVVCHHNISNLLWKKDVLCAWKRESQKHYKLDNETLQIVGNRRKKDFLVV